MYYRLIRWAFARFYREFAWTYDAVAAVVSGGRWSTWGLAALHYQHGRVLELGCGTGNLQRALAGRTADAPVGLDVSAQMLAITRRKLLRAGRPIRLIRAAAQALPFQLAAFDSIVATFPTDYIADPPTLAEVYRVLRPGGRLIVVLGAAFDRDGLYERLVGLAYRLTLQRSPRAAPDRARRSILSGRLAQAGFDAEERWERVDRDQVYFVIGTRI